ncbi:MAG: rhodanese-like domain-containing protein [Candidatus Faecousia sp.]|nr:rhodanese-like domain-containing protein [Candidatus Faecousia sp.]
MIRAISFEDGKKILDTVPGAVLLDVRTEDEYAVEHAAGAKLLPLDDIEDADLPALLPQQDTPILIYCRTGRRSALAAAQLMDRGYENLYDLGGLNGWPYGMEYGLL